LFTFYFPSCRLSSYYIGESWKSGEAGLRKKYGQNFKTLLNSFMTIIKPHHYKIIVRDISEGKEKGFEVFAPALHAYCLGETLEEALEAYYVYFKDEVERRKKANLRMPKPDSMKEEIKQIPLR